MSRHNYFSAHLHYVIVSLEKGTVTRTVEEPSLKREKREREERLLANEQLERHIEDEMRILKEKQKAEEERQQTEYQQQRQREIEQEQTRRKEEELRLVHLEAEVCQCLSELSRLKGNVF